MEDFMSSIPQKSQEKVPAVAVNFIISEPLAIKIDKAMEAWGFATRAEFFRFCAIEFLRFDSESIASPQMIQDYTNTVRRVQAKKALARRQARYP